MVYAKPIYIYIYTHRITHMHIYIYRQREYNHKTIDTHTYIYIYIYMYIRHRASGTKWSVWANEKFHSRSCARACLPVAVFLPVPVPVLLPVTVSFRDPRPSASRPCMTFLRLVLRVLCLLVFFTDFDDKGAKNTPKGSQNGAQSRLRTSLFWIFGKP